MLKSVCTWWISGPQDTHKTASIFQMLVVTCSVSVMPYFWELETAEHAICPPQLVLRWPCLLGWLREERRTIFTSFFNAGPMLQGCKPSTTPLSLRVTRVGRGNIFDEIIIFSSEKVVTVIVCCLCKGYIRVMFRWHIPGVVRLFPVESIFSIASQRSLPSSTSTTILSTPYLTPAGYEN